MKIDIDMNEWDAPDDLDDLADAFRISGDDTPEPDSGPDGAEVIDHEEIAGHGARDVTPEVGLADALDPRDVHPVDPAEIGYPPTLPIEVALQTASDEQIREAYEFTPAQWAALKRSSQFQRDLKNAQDMLRTEGMSFKAKARLQAEELLTTSWGMIHDSRIPATVRADLIKFTVRAAGLEAKIGRAHV